MPSGTGFVKIDMDDFVLGVRTSDIVVFELSNLEHILLLQFYFHEIPYKILSLSRSFIKEV